VLYSIDDKSSRQTARFERQLVVDRRRHSKKKMALLRQRAEVRRLSELISREHKVNTDRLIN